MCYYYDNNHNPRLVIQPGKVEVVHPDPKIYVIRDFLSDVEMDRLKELAAPKVSLCSISSNCLEGLGEFLYYSIYVSSLSFSTGDETHSYRGLRPEVTSLVNMSMSITGSAKGALLTTYCNFQPFQVHWL